MASGIVEMLSGMTEIAIKHEDGDYAELVDESAPVTVNSPVAIRRRDGTLVAMMPLSLWDSARNASIKKSADDWQRRNPGLARVWRRAVQRPGPKRRKK